MSPVRVVVAVDWLGPAQPGGKKAEPLLLFQYVIYPTGQIYTRSIASRSAVPSGGAPLGLMVALAAASESEVQVETPSISAGVRQSSFFAVRHSAGNAVLAFVPGSQGRLVHIYDASTRKLSLVSSNDSENSSVEWSAHLYLANQDAAVVDDLSARAAGYLAEAEIEPLIGSTAPGSSGSIRPDGFDPVGGCYRLKPEGGRVRVRLDGKSSPVFTPAFCVEAAGKRGWVYLKHLIHQPVATSSEGDLVFQLPREVRETQLVEVVLEGSTEP